MPLLVATGAVIAAAWAYLVVARGLFWRVREDAPGSGSPVASAAVVVPARNEAAVIGEAVRSLAAQRYAGSIRILVVDDHSDDGTAELARAASRAVTVVPAQPLPAGWTGKMWAVAQGVERAVETAPDYLLLTDADIVHSPESIRGLVARAEADGLDLASHMVLLSARTLPERFAIPAFVYFFLKLYPPAWIADPHRRTAGAAGGCILIRRKALERIGGIASIRSELIDDCALARRVKASGGRIWMGLTRGTRSVREYRTLGEIWRMVARTAFTQLNHSALLLAGTVAGMLALYVAPVALVFSGDVGAAMLGGSAWAIMSASYVSMLRFYGLPPLWAPILPLVAIFYTGATIDSAVRYWTGRGGMWKGRAQDVHASVP